MGTFSGMVKYVSVCYGIVPRMLLYWFYLIISDNYAGKEI